MLSLSDAARRNATVIPERKRYSRIPEVLPIPDLIELQRDSFRWFIDHGLRELFDEISPIADFTGKVMELHFKAYEFGEPKYSELECRTRDLTYSKPLYVNVELRIKETGEIQEQRVYMGDFQTMTDQGTFIINGAERVVVSQLVRSPGVYYTAVESFHTDAPISVSGCLIRDCAFGNKFIGSYPASFVKATKTEGTGRITSGVNAGKYLNWSIDVGYWLDIIPSDGYGTALVPFF